MFVKNVRSLTYIHFTPYSVWAVDRGIRLKYTYQFFGWGSDSHDSTFIKGAESPENKNTELNQNQDLRKHRHREHSLLAS